MTSSDIANDNGCCYVGIKSTAKGGSAYPSVYQVWQYDADDFVAVKNGTKKAWELIPEVWSFDLPFDDAANPRGLIGATFDQNTNRLYLAQSFGDGKYPVIHVFELNTPLDPPKPPANLNISNQ
jgi:hypothetical protein